MSDTNPETVETPQFKAGDVIRAKWVMDGATTLAEAADRLEQNAATLRRAHDAGWTLNGPINDDYGFLVSPDGNTGDEGDPSGG